METEREQEEQDWRRSPDAEDGRVAERLDQIRERVEHSQSGPRGRAEPLTNDDLDWLYEAARRLRDAPSEEGGGESPSPSSKRGAVRIPQEGHGPLDMDHEIEAAKQALRWKRPLAYEHVANILAYLQDLDRRSEERPGGSGDTVSLSDEDVEHARRWAENATPEQVAAAMREKMRLEDRLRRSTPDAEEADDE